MISDYSKYNWESWSMCEVCRWGMRFWIALIWHKTPPRPFLVITWIKLQFELMADNFLAVNHQPFTTVTRFRFQARPCETWSGQIDTEIGLSPSTSFSPTLHYLSTDKEIKRHAFPSWLFPLKQLIFDMKTEPSHAAFFVSSLLWRQLSLISCCYRVAGVMTWSARKRRRRNVICGEVTEHAGGTRLVLEIALLRQPDDLLNTNWTSRLSTPFGQAGLCFYPTCPTLRNVPSMPWQMTRGVAGLNSAGHHSSRRSDCWVSALDLVCVFISLFGSCVLV